MTTLRYRSLMLPILLCIGACEESDKVVVDTEDLDGDGYSSFYGDCDDSDPHTFPGAAELDSETACMTDSDDDGWGATAGPADGKWEAGTDCDDEAIQLGSLTTDGDCDGVSLSIDCDDQDATLPAEDDEDCDGTLKDVDCDDLDAALNDHDADGDGVTSCLGDCDDTKALIYPGASESCDDVDNDCNGEIDDGLLIDYYPDVDADGYGDASSPIASCDPQPEWITVGQDCDDSNPYIHPEATELCDSVDNDCNGTVDDGITCGVDEVEMCQDENLGTYVGAAAASDTVVGKGRQYDSYSLPYYCRGSGEDYTYRWVSPITASWNITASWSDPAFNGMIAVMEEDCEGLLTCDGDSNPTITIDALEGEVFTLLIQSDYESDSEGEYQLDIMVTSRDEDEDGYDTFLDCDDSDPSISPEAVEICDAIDNDCDGDVDEGLDCEGTDPGDSCQDESLGSYIGTSIATGSTVGLSDDFDGSCGSSGGYDISYRWTVPFTGTFQIDTDGSDFDTLFICGESTVPMKSFVMTMGANLFVP